MNTIPPCSSPFATKRPLSWSSSDMLLTSWCSCFLSAFLLAFYPRPLGLTQRGQSHCLYLSSFIPPQHLLLDLSVYVPTKFLCGDPNLLPDNIRMRGSVEGMRSWRDVTTKGTLGDSLSFPSRRRYQMWARKQPSSMTKRAGIDLRILRNTFLLFVSLSQRCFVMATLTD